MIGSAGRSGALAPVRARPLEPILGVSRGVLVGDLAHGKALVGDADARFVHHDEHRLETAVGLAQELPAGAVVVHHAGRVGVDPHLVLEGAAREPVAASDASVGRDLVPRDDEQRQAFGAGRRTLDPGQDEMDDVLGHVVLARRDEDLLPMQGVAAVLPRNGARPDQTEVRAAMRFGEVHGPGPAAGCERRSVERLLGRRAMRHQGRIGALAEARIHAERHVGRAAELMHRGGQDERQTLAAMFGRGREPRPASRDIASVGFLEPGRRRDGRVGLPQATFAVADPIERLQHLGGESPSFLQDGGDDVGRGLGEAREIAVSLDAEHVPQQEEHFVDGSRIAGHSGLGCRLGKSCACSHAPALTCGQAHRLGKRERPRRIGSRVVKAAAPKRQQKGASVGWSSERTRRITPLRDGLARPAVRRSPCRGCGVVAPDARSGPKSAPGRGRNAGLSALLRSAKRMISVRVNPSRFARRIMSSLCRSDAP